MRPAEIWNLVGQATRDAARAERLFRSRELLGRFRADPEAALRTFEVLAGEEREGLTAAAEARPRAAEVDLGRMVAAQGR